MAGDIWWGDVIRAQSAMGVTTATEFARVARALGFDEAAATAVDAPTRPVDVRQDQPRPGGEQSEAGGVPPPGSGEGPASYGTARSVLSPIGEEAIMDTPPDGPVLARPSPPVPARAAHRPLLSPCSTSGILQYLLSRKVPDGPVDVQALVATIASGRPPRKVKRRPRRTLRFGVQVLVDLSGSMRPFRLDQLQIVDHVKALVAASSTQVRYFADLPLRGAGEGPQWTWRPYQPPAGNGRVLLLTDFGIGGDVTASDRGTPADWSRFFDVVRRAGCQPVALIPYPAARRPEWLRSRCPVLLWDRHVTTGHACMVAP